jgi:hypothetical protein
MVQVLEEISRLGAAAMQPSLLMLLVVMLFFEFWFVALRLSTCCNSANLRASVSCY